MLLLKSDQWAVPYAPISLNRNLAKGPLPAPVRKIAYFGDFLTKFQKWQNCETADQIAGSRIRIRGRLRRAVIKLAGDRRFAATPAGIQPYRWAAAGAGMTAWGSAFRWSGPECRLRRSDWSCRRVLGRRLGSGWCDGGSSVVRGVMRGNRCQAGVRRLVNC